jgi:hypothetical protein
MGRVLHETSEREKRKRKSRNRNEEEADGARQTEITVEEVARQISKLKKRKTLGGTEAWIMEPKE